MVGVTEKMNGCHNGCCRVGSNGSSRRHRKFFNGFLVFVQPFVDGNIDLFRNNIGRRVRRATKIYKSNKEGFVSTFACGVSVSVDMQCFGDFHFEGTLRFFW